jgi:CRISPR/Cas system Type II protein with McrA/HNH and RuvC-like nuclease domain
MDEIYKAGKKAKYFRRTMQDFYITWKLLSDINLEMIKLHRLEIKSELQFIFQYLKNIPESDLDENKGYKKFNKLCDNFHIKYTISSRKVKLSESEKLALINKQGGISGLSKSLIFLGDEVEVDHINPISKGGDDIIENLQVVHKDENRKKGAS